jgi:hypothetical protein
MLSSDRGPHRAGRWPDRQPGEGDLQVRRRGTENGLNELVAQLAPATEWPNGANVYDQAGIELASALVTSQFVQAAQRRRERVAPARRLSGRRPH